MKLTELVEAIDTAVRTAAIRSHHSTICEMARLDDVTIGDATLPGESLMPRDVLAPERVRMDLPVWLTDDEASLDRKWWRKSSRLRLEWRSTESAEATSLVRTQAELQISKRRNDG